METKQKTLAECKDEVAVLAGYDNWKDYESNIGSSAAKMNEMWLAAIDLLNAELYAGQTKQSEIRNPKLEERRSKISPEERAEFERNFDQSSPVSLEVEQAAKDYAADYSNPHNHKKDLKFSESDIFYIRQSTFKDAIKWQSQQPLKLSQITFSEPYQNLQREYAELKQKLESQQQSSNAKLKQEVQKWKDQAQGYKDGYPVMIEELKKQNAELVEKCIETIKRYIQPRCSDHTPFRGECGNCGSYHNYDTIEDHNGLLKEVESLKHTT